MLLFVGLGSMVRYWSRSIWWFQASKCNCKWPAHIRRPGEQLRSCNVEVVTYSRGKRCGPFDWYLFNSKQLQTKDGDPTDMDAIWCGARRSSSGPFFRWPHCKQGTLEWSTHIWRHSSAALCWLLQSDNMEDTGNMHLRGKVSCSTSNSFPSISCLSLLST